MGAGQLFTSTMDVLKRSLDVRLVKHNVIVGNLANAEVPGYKFKDVSFKDAMQTALKGPNMRLARTDGRHLSGGGESEGNAPVTEKADQDIDQEMIHLAENNLMYQASVQLLAKKFEAIKTALT